MFLSVSSRNLFSESIVEHHACSVREFREPVSDWTFQSVANGKAFLMRSISFARSCFSAHRAEWYCEGHPQECMQRSSQATVLEESMRRSGFSLKKSPLEVFSRNLCGGQAAPWHYARLQTKIILWRASRGESMFTSMCTITNCWWDVTSSSSSCDSKIQGRSDAGNIWVFLPRKRNGDSWCS